HPWVRRARSIPSSLKREIVAFRFAYDTFVPEFVMPLPSSPFRSFDEELRQIVEHDEATLAFGFLRPLWDHGGRRDERALGDSSVREHVRRSVDELGADQELARLIFESPRELASRFADLLAAYWEAAFADEWQSLEPALAETVAEAGRRIASDGLYSCLAGPSPAPTPSPSAAADARARSGLGPPSASARAHSDPRAARRAPCRRAAPRS